MSFSYSQNSSQTEAVDVDVADLSVKTADKERY